jgi:hypothetical protein
VIVASRALLCLTFIVTHIVLTFLAVPPWRPRPPPSSPPVPPRDQQRELDNLINHLGVLNLSETMPIYHHYDWHEAVSHEDVLLVGNNDEHLHRLTLDVLLPGPTALEQVEVTVPDDGNKIVLKYTPPMTYLSANHTAARVAVNGGAAGAAQVTAALVGLRALSHVSSSCEQALLVVRQQQASITITIPFCPFPLTSSCAPVMTMVNRELSPWSLLPTIMKVPLSRQKASMCGFSTLR